MEVKQQAAKYWMGQSRIQRGNQKIHGDKLKHYTNTNIPQEAGKISNKLILHLKKWGRTNKT